MDVAKANLDVALRPHAQTWQVPYEAAQIEALVDHLTELSPPSSWSKPPVAWRPPG